MTLFSISPPTFLVSLLLASSWCSCQALQLPTTTSRPTKLSVLPSDGVGRRSILSGLASLLVLLPNTRPAFADLEFSTSASGIQWADAKMGSGSPKQVGEVTAVDYVLSTTGARYGSKIYSTQGNTNSAMPSSEFTTSVPYRWTLGDKSTIQGLELAILGEKGMPPMLPGGVRRVILPSNVAYASLALPEANCQGIVGPVPPPSTAFEEFQRFKNIYCNPNRVYQPNVVMDIKLYGRRATGQ